MIKIPNSSGPASRLRFMAAALALVTMFVIAATARWTYKASVSGELIADYFVAIWVGLAVTAGLVFYACRALDKAARESARNSK